MEEVAQMSLSEQEEFEFRLRAEQEAGGGAPQQSASTPPFSGVLRHGLNSGVAAVGDMFLNAPANAWNLGQGAIGLTKELLGNKDAWLDTKIIPPPNLVQRAFEQVGLIQPEHAPQTTGQRIGHAAAQGAGGALMGPGGALKNMATGAVAAGAGSTAKEATGSEAAGLGVSLLTPFALRAAFAGRRPLNAAQQQTLEQGQQAGYTMPPTEVNPSLVNNMLESAAGKAAIRQQSTLHNQAITDALVARELGLQKGTALTPEVLRAERHQAAQPYRDVANISPRASQTIEALRDARSEASAHWNHFNRSAVPQAARDARTFDALAGQYEDDIAEMANRAGRTNIAKLHDVENSTSVTGEVSARSLGTLRDRKPLTGNLELVGNYEQTFPKFMGEGSKTPTPGVSYTNAILSGGLGAGGAAAFGPWGMALAAVPFARGALRQWLLSQPYQRFATSLPEGFDETALRSALIANALANRGVE
jgi:hypothetical protein